MVSALALALAVGATPVVIEPTDDVWVYQFAQDQTSDPYLRAWGADGRAVGEVGADHMGFSYSLLKFTVPKDLPEVGKATLRLVHTAEPGFDAETAKANPVEARPATSGFDEANWEAVMAKTCHPVADDGTVFGTGWAYPGDAEKPFAVEVDLLAGPNDFRKALAAAAESPNRTLVLALTTRLSPEGAGESSIYKFYSRHNDPDLRPRLTIVAR